jgi:hypothetical protein
MRDTPPKEPPVRVTLYLSEAEHKSLRLESVERRMTLSEIVLEALHSRTFITKEKPS